MADAYPIRPISEEEFGAFYAVIEHAFNGQYPAGRRAAARDRAVFEFDRALAAFDGADMVGTAAALSLRMTVPGGAAAVAGVTAVATAAVVPAARDPDQPDAPPARRPPRTR